MAYRNQDERNKSIKELESRGYKANSDGTSWSNGNTTFDFNKTGGTLKNDRGDRYNSPSDFRNSNH